MDDFGSEIDLAERTNRRQSSQISVKIVGYVGNTPAESTAIKIAIIL